MIEPFASEAGYRSAIDTTIRAAAQELRIFDADLSRMMIEDPARHALLLAFLAGSSERRLLIVLHDPEPGRIRQPRLQKLLRNHGHQIEIRQSPEHLRHLADRFVLADRLCAALRFHADHPRGKLVIDDAIEVQPFWQRFDDLWEASQTCSMAAPAGL